MGGTNSHLVLLPGKRKKKAEECWSNATSLPSLIPLAGRTEAHIRESMEEAMVHVSFWLHAADSSSKVGLKSRSAELSKIWDTKLEKTNTSLATSPETKAVDDSSARPLPLAKVTFTKKCVENHD